MDDPASRDKILVHRIRDQGGRVVTYRDARLGVAYSLKGVHELLRRAGLNVAEEPWELTMESQYAPLRWDGEDADVWERT